MKSMICRFLAAAAIIALPLSVRADPVCPSGPLSDVLALPNATCAIGGTTFAFNHPLNGVPEYFSGPWAGESTWGPASNIVFTPDSSDPSNPGFTLTGNFHTAFAYYDVTLGFFTITAPAGWNIDEYSVDMGNPAFNTTSPQAADIIWLNSLYAMPGAPSVSSASYLVANSIYGNIDLRFWNPSGGDVGFDSASFHFHESNPNDAGTVPEPSSLLLMGTGLASALAFFRKRISAR